MCRRRSILRHSSVNLCSISLATILSSASIVRSVSRPTYPTTISPCRCQIDENHYELHARSWSLLLFFLLRRRRRIIQRISDLCEPTARPTLPPSALRHHYLRWPPSQQLVGRPPLDGARVACAPIGCRRADVTPGAVEWAGPERANCCRRDIAAHPTEQRSRWPRRRLPRSVSFVGQSKRCAMASMASAVAGVAGVRSASA